MKIYMYKKSARVDIKKFRSLQLKQNEINLKTLARIFIKEVRRSSFMVGDGTKYVI